MLRVVAGVMFLIHGIMKLTGHPGGHVVPLDSQLGVGAIIELVAGSMIALGLWTRVFGLLASGQMAVAYMQFHWKFAFDERFFPSVNQGELALVYCFLFLVVACYGGGLASIDNALAVRAGKRVARLA
jgi:putative oxidoreductase